MKLTRLNMNIPVKLLDRIDEYADKVSLNRTSAVIMLLNNGLEQKDTFEILDKLLKVIEEQEDKA